MTERKFLAGPPTTKLITGHSSSPRSLIHVRPTTVRPGLFSVQCASDERLAHGAAVLLDLELNFGEREKVLGIICLFKERIQTVAEVVVLRPLRDALPHCTGRDGLRRLVRLDKQCTM